MLSPGWGSTTETTRPATRLHYIIWGDTNIKVKQHWIGKYIGFLYSDTSKKVEYSSSRMHKFSYAYMKAWTNVILSRNHLIGKWRIGKQKQYNKTRKKLKMCKTKTIWLLNQSTNYSSILLELKSRGNWPALSSWTEHKPSFNRPACMTIWISKI